MKAAQNPKIPDRISRTRNSEEAAMRTVLRTIVVSAVCFCIISAAVPAAAQWIENGIPICTAENWQENPDLLRSDFGMTMIVWEDARSGNEDIYAQCVDPFGNVIWTAGGIPVCTETGNQRFPVAVTDGAGGMIIMWQDSRSGDDDIYAQRLDSEGNALWTAGGVLMVTAVFGQEAIEAIPDGSGGAILTWQDARYGMSDVDIFAERINSSGVSQWAPNGVMICGLSGNQYGPKLVPDGEGGVVIAWDESQSQNVYAMRVRSDGTLLWTVGGVAVTAAAYDQQNCKIVSDGEGGAIIAWQDIRNASDYDIYIQRMDGGGNALWTTDGVALCLAADHQFINGIVPDDNGGAIVSWNDFRGSDSRVYAQQVNRNGLPQWNTTDGSIVCTGVSNQIAYGMVPDGAGGFLIGMTDDRNGDEDIYMQRIAGIYGGPAWTSEGVAVCDYTDEQNICEVVSDGAGGAIVVWIDARNDGGYDIYAQRMDRNGFWGYPCPWIFEAEDVPNDQGGRVMLTWWASRLDSYADEGLQYYSVWRQLGALEMQALLDAGKKETSPARVGPEFDGEAFRLVSLEGAMYGFEWLGNLDAHEMQTYSYAAATLYDSTAVDPAIHTYMVSAHYYPAIFWDSPPVVAYSVDNLAPCMPLELVGEQSFTPAGMELAWTPNTEADLGGYNIYRDIGPSFEPGTGNLIATTCDDHLFDGDWGWDVGFCYKVSAVDVNGNESDFAVLCAEQVTGDDPMPVPDATFLAQNFPNPFNPVTTIGFGLKESGYVSLRIYDAAGRLVTTLVDESRPAGRYTTQWNGQSTDGSTVASGVYFYKLTAKEFEETKKMILLR
jgi:predicted lipoprotein with Yx(FWY)xxD motif